LLNAAGTRDHKGECGHVIEHRLKWGGNEQCAWIMISSVVRRWSGRWQILAVRSQRCAGAACAAGAGFRAEDVAGGAIKLARSSSDSFASPAAADFSLTHGSTRSHHLRNPTRHPLHRPISRPPS
jgi:hypothetical protein